MSGSTGQSSAGSKGGCTPRAKNADVVERHGGAGTRPSTGRVTGSRGGGSGRGR